MLRTSSTIPPHTYCFRVPTTGLAQASRSVTVESGIALRRRSVQVERIGRSYSAYRWRVAPNGAAQLPARAGIVMMTMVEASDATPEGDQQNVHVKKVMIGHHEFAKGA